MKMGWLDRLMARIAPGHAVKSYVARSRLEMLSQAGERLRMGDMAPSGILSGPQQMVRSFDAASGSRLRFDSTTESRSPDGSVTPDMASLRNTVRHFEQNSGRISGPIQRAVNHVVGQGIQCDPRVVADTRREIPRIDQQMADDWNFYAKKTWTKWAGQADIRLQWSFGELLRLVEGALMRDNEVLVIIRKSTRKSRLLSSCLQILEIDRLVTPMSEFGNGSVRNGIRFDSEGVPTSYFVYKNHPGEVYTLSANDQDIEEVPAFFADGTRKVLHLFHPMRPEQTRAVTMWAAALKDIQDWDRYSEAEIYAMLEDACLTGFVKTAQPTTFASAYTKSSGSSTTGYERIHEFAPAKWHYLAPGEEVQIHAPQRPNTAFQEMSRQLASGPANALNMPPEVFSQDWKGMNYSNARTVLNQFQDACRIRQGFLINHVCRPVYEVVMPEAVARGLVPAPAWLSRKDDFLRAVWIPRGWDYVDPLKEAEGKRTELEIMSTTLTDIAQSKGRDIDDIIDTRASELRKIADAEARYGVKFTASDADNTSMDDEEPPEEQEQARSVRFKVI